MRASDVLHNLADLLSGVQKPQAVEPQQPQTVSLVQVSADNTDHSDPAVFVPPLQAKIELLKKSVGVDSVYDQQGGDDLTRMKQMAGIQQPNIIAQDEAGSDEPLDV